MIKIQSVGANLRVRPVFRIGIFSGKGLDVVRCAWYRIGWICGIGRTRKMGGTCKIGRTYKAGRTRRSAPTGLVLFGGVI